MKRFGIWKIDGQKRELCCITTAQSGSAALEKFKAIHPLALRNCQMDGEILRSSDGEEWEASLETDERR